MRDLELSSGCILPVTSVWLVYVLYNILAAKITYSSKQSIYAIIMLVFQTDISMVCLGCGD